MSFRISTAAGHVPEINAGRARIHDLTTPAPINELVPTYTAVGYTPTGFDTGVANSPWVLNVAPDLPPGSLTGTGTPDPRVPNVNALRLPQYAMITEAVVQATEPLNPFLGTEKITITQQFVVLDGPTPVPPVVGAGVYVATENSTINNSLAGVAVHGNEYAVGNIGASPLSLGTYPVASIDGSIIVAFPLSNLTAGALKVSVAYQLPKVN